jgi:hypothetical protein
MKMIIQERYRKPIEEFIKRALRKYEGKLPAVYGAE